MKIWKPCLKLYFYPLHRWSILPRYDDCSGVYSIYWLFFVIEFYWDTF